MRFDVLTPSSHYSFIVVASPVLVNGRLRAASNESVSHARRNGLRNARFRDQVATLTVAVREVSKEEIEGEDVRQQRRICWNVRAVIAALTALVLLASVLAVVANIQRLIGVFLSGGPQATSAGGTFGAHGCETCPAAMRAAEISAAGQSPCQEHPP